MTLRPQTCPDSLSEVHCADETTGVGWHRRPDMVYGVGRAARVSSAGLQPRQVANQRACRVAHRWLVRLWPSPPVGLASLSSHGACTSIRVGVISRPTRCGRGSQCSRYSSSSDFLPSMRVRRCIRGRAFYNAFSSPCGSRAPSCSPSGYGPSRPVTAGRKGPADVRERQRRGSVVSRPSLGAPVPEEPRNNLFPSANVRSRPLPFRDPSLA